MKAIYEPRGAAREYAPLALNLYRGCSHGCLYCYSPSTVRRGRKDFRENVTVRKDILAKLKSDMGTWDRSDERTVLLSFTSDPYQPLDRELYITRQALEIMDGIVKNVSVLTKAGFDATADFDILQRNDWLFGTTLTTLNAALAAKWEPNVASPLERLSACRYARNRAVSSWVSIEPTLNPDEAFRVLDAINGWGIAVRIGKWNHSAEANVIDWEKYVQRLVEYGKKGWEGRAFYVKDALARHGSVPEWMRQRPFG